MRTKINFLPLKNVWHESNTDFSYLELFNLCINNTNLKNFEQ
jgi:hypothetical protein